jgi:hypothetical protein
MTNMIQIPTSQTLISSNNLLASKQSLSMASSSFDDMFSTLLSDLNSISGSCDAAGTSNDLMTPLLLIMYNKLLGSEATTTNTGSTPQGTPVNGILTQTSHEGHVALDFGVPIGTNVKSTLKGTVTYAGWNNEGYGNLVIVENGAYKTYYAHLSSIPVKVGQTVGDGEVIGLSGNTGNSTGPHLHYEIRKNGVAINPLSTISN